jgi:spore germination protein YaaH
MPDVKAAIASIKLDDGPGGLCTNFERAVALLVPVDPANKRRGTKRSEAEISAAGVKQRVGPEAGVEIRYYKAEEYKKLSKEEQEELRELCKKRKTNPNSSHNNCSGQNTNDAKFPASVVNAVKKQMLEEEKTKNSTIEAIAGILKKSSVSSVAPDTVAS